MTQKRMGGMSLSSFSKASTQTETETEPTVSPQKKPQKKSPKPKQSEELVTVNIKITESQQEWLAKTSKQVRRNNDEAVAASDRCYPQHLIGIAIDLLKDAEVDWAQVKNAGDLRKILGL